MLVNSLSIWADGAAVDAGSPAWQSARPCLIEQASSPVSSIGPFHVVAGASSGEASEIDRGRSGSCTTPRR